MGQIVRDRYPPTPTPWGENPKVNFKLPINSHYLFPRVT